MCFLARTANFSAEHVPVRSDTGSSPTRSSTTPSTTKYPLSLLTTPVSYSLICSSFTARENRSAESQGLRRPLRRLVSRYHTDGGSDWTLPLPQVELCVRAAVPGCSGRAATAEPCTQRQPLQRGVCQPGQHLVSLTSE